MTVFLGSYSEVYKFGTILAVDTDIVCLFILFSQSLCHYSITDSKWTNTETDLPPIKKKMGKNKVPRKNCLWSWSGAVGLLVGDRDEIYTWSLEGNTIQSRVSIIFYHYNFQQSNTKMPIYMGTYHVRNGILRKLGNIIDVWHFFIPSRYMSFFFFG